MDTQQIQDALIERAAAAFSQDKMDETGFEAFVARVHRAKSSAELRAAEALLLPLEPPPSPGIAAYADRSPGEKRGGVRDERTFSLNMSNLKKRGVWVDARHYRLEGKMSNFEMDFRSYADETNFSLSIDVDLSMSNLRLRVPSDWDVDCRIDRNTASNIKDRGPDGTVGNNRIVIDGALSMSNIKIKRYRRGRRRGLLFLLLGR